MNNIDVTTAIDNIKKIFELMRKVVEVHLQLTQVMNTQLKACENQLVIALLEKCNTISKEAKMNKKFKFTVDENYYKLEEDIYNYEMNLVYKASEKENCLKYMEACEQASHVIHGTKVVVWTKV